MVTFAMGMAVLLAVAIMVIGTQYIVAPRAATRGFGLPLPDPGAHTDWWLRLKGVRDIAAGAVVLTLMASSGPKAMGLALLALALIPIGDMGLVLGGKGSVRLALGMHAVTAIVMVATGVGLLLAAG
nr:DUF4267 domain-containing protein [uncultured Massilia sp.]